MDPVARRTLLNVIRGRTFSGFRIKGELNIVVVVFVVVGVVFLLFRSRVCSSSRVAKGSQVSTQSLTGGMPAPDSGMSGRKEKARSRPRNSSSRSPPPPKVRRVPRIAVKVERPTSSDESPPRLPMPPPPPQRKKKLPVAVKEVREEEPISERRKWEKEMYMKQFKTKSLPTPPPSPPPSPGPAREEKIRKKKLPVAVKKEEEERLYAKSEEQIKVS